MKSEASARWRWPLRADDWQSTPTAGCVTANHLLAGGATPPCQHLHARFCSVPARHLLIERYSRHLPRPSGWRRFPHQRARIFPQLWISIADGSSPVRSSRTSPPLPVLRRRVISCGAFDLWERAKTGWTSKIEVRGLDRQLSIWN